MTESEQLTPAPESRVDAPRDCSARFADDLHALIGRYADEGLHPQHATYYLALMGKCALDHLKWKTVEVREAEKALSRALIFLPQPQPNAEVRDAAPKL